MNRRDPEQWLQCPKCKRFSGDDWTQCNGSCPVEGSPHFRQSAVTLHGSLIKRTPEEVRDIQIQLQRRASGLDDEIPF